MSEAREFGPGERRRLLLDLLEGTAAPALLQEQLRAFPWDSDELVVLKARQLEAVLARFLSGEVDARWVAAWAEAIEVRDDIGIEPGREELLSAAIFDLANPTINGPLDGARAQTLLAALRRAHDGGAHD